DTRPAMAGPVLELVWATEVEMVVVMAVAPTTLVMAEMVVMPAETVEETRVSTILTHNRNIVNSDSYLLSNSRLLITPISNISKQNLSELIKFPFDI
ncbi:hypothetical protein K7432_016862, partial [Basidiobolus ranarum]